MLRVEKLKYNKKIAREICDLLSTTAESIKSLCASHSSDPTWPDQAQIYRWKLKYPEFKKDLLEAQKINARNRLQKITDDIEDDDNLMMIVSKECSRIDPAYVNLMRLRAESARFSIERFEDNGKSNTESVMTPIVLNMPSFK